MFIHRPDTIPVCRPARRAWLLGLSLVLTLSACGGCGHDASSFQSFGPTTGVLSGLQVEGLRYKTPTQSGELDASQSFSYSPGETVVFKIGDTILGESLGQPMLTVQDWIPGLVLPLTHHVAVDAMETSVSLWRITNLSILLATVDDDGNPSNGISIPPTLHALLTSNMFDFAQRPRVFRECLELRQLRRDGLAAGLWGGVGRPITQSAAALNALYAALAVPHEFHRPTYMEFDGNADAIVDLTETWSFASDGQLSENSIDTDANGLADLVYSISYDAHGRNVHEMGVDGLMALFYELTTIRDANGLPIHDEFDATGDGTPDRVSDWSRNALGDVTTMLEDTTFDGIPNLTDVRTYHPSETLETMQRELDPDDDGVVDTRIHASYDLAGILQERTTDHGADGTINVRVTFVTSGDGLAREEHTDHNDDGTVDVSKYFTVHPLGNRLSFDWDKDGNGTIDHAVAITRDAEGRELNSTFDSDGDGLANELRANTYNALGLWILYTHDSDADGNSNLTMERTFDSAGRKLSRSVDTDGDGVFDTKTTWIHDSNGYVIRSEVDLAVDGTIDVVVTIVSEPGTWWDVLEDGEGHNVYDIGLK